MLSKLRHWSNRAVEVAAVLVTLAMLLTVVIGVVTRALDDPAIWTDELARYLLVWVASLGWVIASRRRVHIRITFLLDMLPGRARRAAEIAIQVAVALFGVLLAFNGIELVEKNYDLEATTMPISTALIYAPAILVGVAVALQAIGQAAEAGPSRVHGPCEPEGWAE